MKSERIIKLKKIFPALGMRIIKTAIALLAAMVLSDYVFKLFLPALDTNSVCVFAILSVQDSVQGTWKFVLERLLGNFIGLACGFLFLFLFSLTVPAGLGGSAVNGNFIFYLFVALGTIAAIYLCKAIHRASASAVTIIVFLGIMFGAVTPNPYANAAYIVLQMAIGVAVAVAINLLIARPGRRRTENVIDETGVKDVKGVKDARNLQEEASETPPPESGAAPDNGIGKINDLGR